MLLHVLQTAICGRWVSVAVTATAVRSKFNLKQKVELQQKKIK